MFKGIYTALISPFREGKLDLESLESLVIDQIKKGIDGFVVNGTTAESPTLEKDEVYSALNKVNSLKQGQKIIVGCGSNSTKKTIDFAKELEAKGGFDAFLIVVPYYNKPTQEGMYAHFKAIHDATKTPIILYNVPGRTIVSLSPETSARLASLPRILGIKDATGDMDYYKKARDMCGPDFCILSGDDASFVDFSLLGGDGCISVLSHVLPAEMKSCYKKALSKDDSCIADYKNYAKIAGLLFKEPNPSPTKYALKKMQVIATNDVRLPLLPTSVGLEKEIDAELERLKII